jgi:hypothetical protein
MEKGRGKPLDSCRMQAWPWTRDGISGRIFMRCTRCDDLAVPQAVGIAPDGRVVFGWCLQCLADQNCRLVETASGGPFDFARVLSSRKLEEAGPRVVHAPARRIDQSRRIVAGVAFFLVCWGLILMAAGLLSRPGPAGSSPLGNGTAMLLGTGGAATALLGLALKIYLARARRLLVRQGLGVGPGPSLAASQSSPRVRSS